MKNTHRGLGRWIVRMVLAALGWMVPSVVSAVDTVTVNPATNYQTVIAWGVAATSIATAMNEPLRTHIIDEFVNGLGLTRTRGEIGGTWEPFNDNGTPYSTETSQFNTAVLDNRATTYWLPMKRMVEANGEKFSMYTTMSFFSTGSTGTAPPWLSRSPAEHAEGILAELLWIKNVHGIDVDYCTVLNEAGYNNPYSATVCANVIRELGPRLQAAGLSAKFQFPECTSTDQSFAYLQAVENDPDIWPYIGLISTHLYQPPSDPSRSYIRDFARSKNLPTAQTEFLTPTVETLYSDLTDLGVSVWEWYGRLSWSKALILNTSKTWFSRGSEYWNTRQILHYVRPGAVRVGAVSSGTGTAIRPLAFTHNGKTTVILLNTSSGNTAKTADVNGLTPSTTYGISRTVAGVYAEAGLFTSSSSGTLAGVSVPANSVVTLYPAGSNQPPTIVDWQATPALLTWPRAVSNVTLTASAQDPELAGPVTYSWALASQPAGADVSLATPAAASCVASNLTVAGIYVFSLTVTDAENNSCVKTVEVPVFAANQTPILADLHNRNPVLVQAKPNATTELRVAAWDIEGDSLMTWDGNTNVLFKWEIVSQPAGASATMTQIKDVPPDTTAVIPSAGESSYTMGALAAAGDYVVKVTVMDSIGNTTSQQKTVSVYPANVDPVISNYKATPAAITLPVSDTALTAATSDPDAAAIAPWRPSGDVLTHWWTTTTNPAGAAPVFATPAEKDTTVSGLTVPGTYKFMLHVMDRYDEVTKEITVTVNPGLIAAGFSATPGSGWVPLTVSFTDTSTGIITNRVWDFGDGATTNTSATNLTHTYTSAGTHTVRLVVSGPDGVSTNTQIAAVTVAAPVAPSAGFSVSPASGTVPLAVTFTDTSTGSVTNRFWDFGDGFTTNTTATTVAHTYTVTGTSTVQLIVSGPSGASTNTQVAAVTVTLPTAPAAGFSASPTSGTAPRVVSFTDTSTGTITNRFWSFGDGATTNTSATNLTHTYLSAGTNTVQLIVSGPAGDSTNSQIIIISAASASSGSVTRLDISSAFNYDAVVTDAERLYAISQTNKTAAGALGDHAISSTTTSYAFSHNPNGSYKGLPTDGLVVSGKYEFAKGLVGSAKYGTVEGTTKVNNTVSTKGFNNAWVTVTLPLDQQQKYSDFNVLMSSRRYTTAGKTVNLSANLEYKYAGDDTWYSVINESVSSSSSKGGAFGGRFDNGGSTAPATDGVWNPVAMPATGIANGAGPTVFASAQCYAFELATPVALDSTKTLEAIRIKTGTSNTQYINEGFLYAVTATLADTPAPGGTDDDSDGIPNDWETRHFGGNTNAHPNAMAANGVNTIYETYIAGLNPTNPAERFNFSAQQTASQQKLQWNAASGRVYSIYRSTNLLNGFEPLETNIVWPQNSWTGQINGLQADFYKIKVQLGNPQ